MGTKIVYCDKCGEYLGDIVNGVLYKFGQVVSQSHICETPKKLRSHILTDEEFDRSQEEFRELGSNY